MQFSQLNYWFTAQLTSVFMLSVPSLNGMDLFAALFYIYFCSNTTAFAVSVSNVSRYKEFVLMKRTFYTETAYALGIVLLAFGTAFMEKADFGMSMVVAPAYLIYLKISEYVSWFTFGMAEYCLQAALIIVLAIVMHGFKRKHLFSFITAFIYGNMLDAAMKVLSIAHGNGLMLRTAYYCLGLIVCAIGVSLLFKTYIPPEAYELFVKEISSKFNLDISKTKTVYDCCSCMIAIAMSFLFIGFGQFEGVKLGTVFCALINGWTIGKCCKWLEKHFTFIDAFSFREHLD